MKLKKYFYIALIPLLVLMWSFLVVGTYAADQDLTNLTDTTSVTIDIGGSYYTVNNTQDRDGLFALKKAIDNYRKNTNLNSYHTVYEQTINHLINYADSIKAADINNVVYFYNNKFYEDINHTTLLKQEDGTEYTKLEQLINTAEEDLVISLLTQYTVKTDEKWEPTVNIILFRGNSDGKRFLEFNSNINLDMKPTETGSLTIDGYKQSVQTSYTPIRASQGSTINIYDRVIIKEFYCSTNGGTMYLNGGTINIYGGIFYNNEAGSTGGFIYCTSGIFNVYDGIFANHYSNSNGAVFNVNFATTTSGSVNLTGGVFVNNSTKSNGGAIQVSKGSITMENATVYNNSAANGAFLYVSTGTLRVNNSLVYDNTSVNHGGAIYMKSGEVEILGGYIGIEKDDFNNTRSNKSTNGNGGAIYISGGTMTVDGGTITSNIAESQNGGAVFIDGGTFTVNNGNLYNNEAFASGGGAYIDGGTFTLNGGNIYSNKAPDGGGIFANGGETLIKAGNIGLKDSKGNIATTGNGGGINIAGGNVTISGGVVGYNTAANLGGGLYLDGGKFNMNSGSIQNNEAINGAGSYITNSTFNLTGGTFSHNQAEQSGGGFFVGDNSIVTLSNGEVKNNTAQNGSGFYQTQTTNQTKTELTGNCIVTENQTINGNGAGVYIDGGSTFRMIGGKITYNEATLTNTLSNTVTAKESTAGVGGGVYILKGTFSMYDEEGNKGNAAIFGNKADYAADDLFATGENTSFDAISVIEMSKADTYKTADSWFEDYPKDESHITLNATLRNDSDTSNDTIVSLGRYKDMEDAETKKVATTVLNRNCTDYIAITMGNSVGKLKISVIDKNVIRAHSFIYRIESCSDENCNDLAPDIKLEVVTQKGSPASVVDIPTGIYKVTIIPTWPWRYDKLVKYDITENSIKLNRVTKESVNINIYSEQYTYVDTSYTQLNKKYLSTTKITESNNTTLLGGETDEGEI